MFKIYKLCKEITIMIYKNGYKVVYEVAADGKRTFYATKSNTYPAADDIELATFDDADFAGKTIYEYKGEFYVSTGAIPAYNEDGTPADEKITGFEKLFVEETATPANEAAEVETGTETTNESVKDTEASDEPNEPSTEG
jgi:hypothetical protein